MYLRTLFHAIAISVHLTSVYGVFKEHLKEEFKYADEISKLKVTSSLGNEIIGFQIDMGTEEEAKAYKDPVIYYGKAWAWLNIHYAFHDKNNRLLLAKELTKKQEKQYLGKRVGKEGLSKKINVRCLQPKRSVKGKPEGKDDCLTLNVIAPPITDAKHPVYVHIHGGSLVSGAAEVFGYKGLVRNFAEQNIIVVTLNYRLGPEGFLKVPFLTDKERDSHERYVINRGIEDCILALRWVKNNIANFGGDVNNITLGGNSAGASIVEMIALQENQSSNEQFNLFHKFILHGGTFDICGHFSTYDEDIDEIVQEQFCPRKTQSGSEISDSEMWKCLTDPPKEKFSHHKDQKFGINAFNPENLFNLWSIKTPDLHGRFKDVVRGLFQTWEPRAKDIKVLILESEHEHSTIDQTDIRPKAPLVDGKKLPYGEEYLKFALDILLKPYDRFHGPNWAADKIHHRNQPPNQPNIISDLIRIYKEDLNSLARERMQTGLVDPGLKEQDAYKLYIRLVTHIIWSTRSLEDAIRLLRKGHKVYMMRFSHEKQVTGEVTDVNESPWPDTVKVTAHDDVTRYILMHERHWSKQKKFQNSNELAVADKMKKIVANFIRNGDPRISSEVVPAPNTTVKQWLWQTFDACKQKCGEMFCNLNASKQTNDEPNMPYFFEVRTSYQASGKMEIHENDMCHWINPEPLKFWCEFYETNRQAPFTNDEMTAPDKKKVKLPKFAMCDNIR